MHACMHACIHVSMGHTYMDTCIQILSYIYTCIHACMHACIQIMSYHVLGRTCSHTHSPQSNTLASKPCKACVRVWLPKDAISVQNVVRRVEVPYAKLRPLLRLELHFTCIHNRVSLCVRVHTPLHVRMHARTHVRMYVCMYVRTYVWHSCISVRPSLSVCLCLSVSLSLPPSLTPSGTHTHTHTHTHTPGTHTRTRAHTHNPSPHPRPSTHHLRPHHTEQGHTRPAPGAFPSVAVRLEGVASRSTAT